jgi:hypothetical protein
MHSRNLFKPFYLLMGVTLVVPFAAKSGAVDVNGTCEVGVCSPVSALSDGQSTSGAMNFTYTFGNGDTYAITGSYAASYSTAGGSTISFDPAVTYMGASPSVGTDVLNLTLFQNYFDTTCCTWAGDYTESIPLNLSASAGPGSSVSGELLYDGQSVGLVGPFGPGSNTGTLTTSLDFGALNSADTLAAQFKIYLTFGAGTLSGASATSPAVPEPALMVPGGLCLLALAFAARRQNRSRVAL